VEHLARATVASPAASLDRTALARLDEVPRLVARVSQEQRHWCQRSTVRRHDLSVSHRASTPDSPECAHAREGEALFAAALQDHVVEQARCGWATYQPLDRCWPFQWIETGIYAPLTEDRHLGPRRRTSLGEWPRQNN
jgi:hypothetical protein